MSGNPPPRGRSTDTCSLQAASRPPLPQAVRRVVDGCAMQRVAHLPHRLDAQMPDGVSIQPQLRHAVSETAERFRAGQSVAITLKSLPPRSPELTTTLSVEAALIAPAGPLTPRAKPDRIESTVGLRHWPPSAQHLHLSLSSARPEACAASPPMLPNLQLWKHNASRTGLAPPSNAPIGSIQALLAILAG